MRNIMNKRNAFTTAELMVAIAVMGVLAALMIPSLKYHVQHKVFEYSADIQTKKLAQAITMLSIRSASLSYQDTGAFVRDLKKYARMSKSCEKDNDKVEDCWPYDKVTLVNGESYNMANATGPNAFVKGSVGSQAVKTNYSPNNVSFVTDSGVAVLINYNKVCSPNAADENKSCYMALIDVNGDKSPNTVGEDVFVINAKGFVVDPSQKDEDNNDKETTGINQAKKQY